MYLDDDITEGFLQNFVTIRPLLLRVQILLYVASMLLNYSACIVDHEIPS